MTDHPHNRVREAVYEIVNTAPLAPAVDDLESRRVERRKRSPILVVAIVMLIVVALVALTSRVDESPETNGTTVESTAPTLVVHEPTATDAFRLLRESQSAVGNIDTLAGPLIQSCMAAKGFTFTPNSTVLMVEQDQSAFLRQRYPEPRQQDGTWGYVFENLSAGSDPIEPDNSPPAGQASAYLEAFNGKTVTSGVVRDLDGKVVTSNQIGDGCYGQSMATIMGSQQAFIDFFTKLQTLEVTTGQSFNLVRNSTDYLARNQLWSQCMKNAGFDYRTISDPWNQDWPSPRPSATEQQVAETDAGCRRGRSLDGPDLNLLEAQTLTELLLAHPLGDYSIFDHQVQALLIGKTPSPPEAPTASVTTVDESS